MRVNKPFLLAWLLLCIGQFVHAQVQSNSCTIKGQTPQTAFPVCGTDTFYQSTVPICTNSNIFVPGCSGTSNASYADKNPFWYKFTCYQAGTLGFLVIPNNLGDDYDWQLYDVTGLTDLNQVYLSSKYFVVGNWSGSYGVTGASSAGTKNVQCASDPADNIPTYSAMPILKVGHQYLLMVSHFDDSQSGYKLIFTGGTAVITDNTLPDLKSVQTVCDGSSLRLKLNKKIKCSSLAGDGTDFIIQPALATVTAASGGNCDFNFDMDSVIITLSNSLPAGNYQLVIQNGDDANTLLDDCDRNIPQGNRLPFTVSPPAPTQLDSLTPPSCAPKSVQLVFSKNIRCESIAPDGSDFSITGPSGVTISSASGACYAGFTNTINLVFSAAVTIGGTYTVSARIGTDGNTLIDECGQQTPVGSATSFTLKDTVSADFTYVVNGGCNADTVVFAHDGAHGVNQWQWLFYDGGAGSQQVNTVVYTHFGVKQISLAVSNGFCSDTMSKNVPLPFPVLADFTASNPLCPEDAATLVNTSTGVDITGYTWDFGDGTFSQDKDPAPKQYPISGAGKNYVLTLTVQNKMNCIATKTDTIQVLRSCYIAVPNAFTPNGDGNNDYLYPLNAFKADNLEFDVYNRLGQRVFHSTNWTQKWDGSINGRPQQMGTFVWTLRYVDHDTGKKVSKRGTTVLIR